MKKTIERIRKLLGDNGFSEGDDYAINTKSQKGPTVFFLGNAHLKLEKNPEIGDELMLILNNAI